MKTGSFPQVSTRSTLSRKRFGALSIVPLTAVISLLLLFWHISPTASLAQTPETPNAIRYAAPAGSGAECSSLNPCALQTAVTFAADGDTIHVLEGIYPNNPGQPTLLITRNVTILGGFYGSEWNGPDPSLHPTILDAGDNNRVIQHQNSAESVLDGFHIRNGLGTFGGGVYVVNGRLTVDNSWIYDNAANSGGAIFVSNGAEAIIQNSEIYNNSAPGGGAIYVSFGGARADILYNNIHNNNATTGAASGGALFLTSGSTAFVEGNYIHHNASGQGGGIFVDGGSTVTAQNNMVYANTASNEGGGFHAFGVLASWHNTVVGNSAVNGGVASGCSSTVA
ncbi:MAG TPA: right-handed parallel beta-helix repeat-containing protein, partial [Chloroflexota bacterium]|nr:right-handed parallel beta-helix repeat-containing protein [Chloroflexota bacterium]